MAKILVADDDVSIGHLIALRFGAHKVEVVTGGQEAINRVVSGGRFDVIFCDVNMPVVDGLGVHAAIHRKDPEQARRIVFVTAGARRSAAGLAKLPNRILTKPFPHEDLREVVEGFLPISLLPK